MLASHALPAMSPIFLTVEFRLQVLLSQLAEWINWVVGKTLLML
jgi:hypothetical protein